MHMITVMLVGIAMGSTVMIGRYVGERKEEEKDDCWKYNHNLYDFISDCYFDFIILY